MGQEGRDVRRADRSRVASETCAALQGREIKSPSPHLPTAPGHLSSSPISGCGWAAGPSMR